MMRHKWAILCLCLAPLAGACATLVGDDTAPDKYAPEGAKPRSGKVIYNPNGLKEIVDWRREDAFKKMVEFCGSRKYTIAREHDVSSDETAADDGSLATAGAQEVHMIEFDCQ